MNNHLCKDIAVIGMACKFPGANGPEEYWHNIINGVESIVELSHVSADNDKIPFSASLNDDVLSFDADFFGVSHRDAALIDPQHRLFLECAWHALEHAGINSKRYEDTGLFAGCSNSSYLPYLLKSELINKFQPSSFELQITNDKDYLVSRTAWHLGIEGPVIGVQAACATSLVAVSEAVAALRSGRCRQALAGGCTIQFPQYMPYHAQQGMVYSKNGHCMPFAKDASGTVFGSGVALVVLKSLNAAIEDNDNILAVIKGCAVTNDGSHKVGFTTTSPDGQRRLINKAMEDANATPADLRAIETHGTGTIAGDPIEFNVLNSIFLASNVPVGRCALGAVKANVGHLETCAGMAGLIKAILEIKNNRIAPQINIKQYNPSICLDSSPLYFPLSDESWEEEDNRNLIGVSAFGIGGTNAHVLLSRFKKKSNEIRQPNIYPPAIPISGHSELACCRLIKTYQKNCISNPAHILAWNSQTTRTAKRYRTILLPDNERKLKEISAIYDCGRHKPHIVFLFPGQGSQFLGMAKDLAKNNSCFSSILKELIEKLHQLTKIDVSFILHDDSNFIRIKDTCIVQPALIVVQLAMARFVMLHGIIPDTVIGHSLGEITAAYVAGLISDSQALNFAAHRGKLMSGLPSGSMLAVDLDESSCTPWLSNDISLAAINGTNSCVFSGAKNAIEDLQISLSSKGIRCRQLIVSHAFHSSMMDPILNDLEMIAPVSQEKKSGVKFCSTLFGAVLESPKQLNPVYWSRHAREPVRFFEALNSLPTGEKKLFIEVGPGSTLTALVKILYPNEFAVRTMRHERDKKPESEIWHLALQNIWMSGIDLDWKPSWEKPVDKISLPLYPFDTKCYGVSLDSNESLNQLEIVSQGTPLTSEYKTLEEAVSILWEICTGVKPSEPNRLFSDDGGDSLAVIQLAALADSKLGIKINISDFMREPTPSGLYNCLSKIKSEKDIKIKENNEEG